jgi:hypothetical protein
MGALKLLTYVCASASLLFVCPSTAAQVQLDVKWSNERLSVRVADASLAEVIGEVARVAGLEVIGREKLTGLVSADFTELPPGRALATLLEGVNYIIQERPDPHGGPSPQLVVRVHSMSANPVARRPFTGPVYIAALEAVVAAEADDVRDEKEVEHEDRLDDPDWDLDRREEEIEASRLSNAGAFGPKADLGSLIKLADDPNEYVRLEAVKALGARPMPSVLGALTKALKDEAWDVRTLAVEILGAATDTRSLRAVGEKLEKDADYDFRISALRVLALRGEPESAVHIRAVLKHEDSRLHAAAEQMIEELERRARERRAHAAK